jgi:hypothetical protein
MMRRNLLDRPVPGLIALQPLLDHGRHSPSVVDTTPLGRALGCGITAVSHLAEQTLGHAPRSTARLRSQFSHIDRHCFCSFGPTRVGAGQMPRRSHVSTVSTVTAARRARSRRPISMSSSASSCIK